MKILELGPGATEYGRWYLRHPITCRRCGTKFQVEPGDPCQSGIKQMAGDDTARHYVVINCPGCGISVWKTGPMATLMEELEYASSRDGKQHRQQLERTRAQRHPNIFVKGID